ncbi:MAG: hypothetical protein DCF22_10270 [Leptolyngbya sp.]|nr:MAG: hypothetical protein DCF22_10270 [Leptolyngbya sp.]
MLIANWDTISPLGIVLLAGAIGTLLGASLERARERARQKKQELSDLTPTPVEAALQPYERVISSTPDGVALLDRTYTYRLINQPYLDWNQKRQEEIVGHTVSDLLGETLFQSTIQPKLDRCLAGETICYGEWFNYPTGDAPSDLLRQRRFVSLTYSPYTEADGTISGVVVNSRDLTDLKQVEEALKDSKAFLNQIINVISDTIFVKDEQFRFVLVNQALCEVMGIPQAAFLGKTDYDFFPQAQADHFRQKDQLVFQTGLEDVTEEPLTTPNGDTHWLLTKKACFQNERGQKFLVGSSRDITQRKQAEVVLQQQALQEQAFSRVIRTIRNSLDLETIFSTATREFAELLQLDLVDILQAFPERHCSIPIAEHIRQPDALSLLGVEIPDDNNPIAQRLKQREIVLVENTHTLQAPVNQAIAQLHDPVAQLMVPLEMNETVWGCLIGIKSPLPATFTEDEICLARRFADQLAIAIQQANLYQQAQLELTERKRIEAELGEREAVLRDLYQATSDRHLSFQQKLRQLLAVGCRYFQLENGMVAVLEADICRAIATHSPLPDWVEGRVYDVNQAFCGEALQREEPFSIQHVGVTEWRNHSSYALFGTETYIATKIQVKNTVHAILCFTSTTPCPRLIQPADKELIKLMAQWIGGEIERQHAETALQQLNEQLEQRVQARTQQLQLALSAAKMGTWEWDMLTNRQSWSAENYALWGFCTDASGRILDQAGVEISPFPTFEFVFNRIHPDDRESLLQTIQHTSNQSQPYEIEHRILWDDDSIHWRYSRGSYVFNDQGKPIKLVAIAMDITDRKQSEAEIRRSQDLFEATFQESADAIFLVDTVSLLIVDCNQRAIALFEADHKQNLVGIQGYSMHKIPFTEAELVAARQEFKLNGVWTQEIEYRTLKGHCFWGNFASKLIQVAEQQMNLVRLTDISDRKRVEAERQQAEAALRQSEARFQYLAAHIPGIFYQSLIRADGSRQFHYVSSGFQRLFELAPAQLIEDPSIFWSMVHPDDMESLQAEVSRTLITHEPFQFEYRIIPASGRIKWIHNVASREYLENGDIVSDGLVLDISDRKQTEAALQVSESRLRTLIEDLQVGVVVFNADLTPQLFNSKILELMEVTADEMQHSTLRDPRWAVVREDGSPMQIAEYPMVVAAKTCQSVLDVVIGVYRPISQDRVWLLVTAEPQMNEMGEVKQVITTASDISDRRRVEQALRQFAGREHLLRTVTQQIYQSLDLDSILTSTVNEVRQMLQVDRALIFHLTSDSSGVVLKESVLPDYPTTAAMLWEDECFPAECYRYYQQGNPRVIPDVAVDEWTSCLVDFMQAAGVKSKVVAPIVLGIEDALPRLWGILVVHSCSHYRQWEPAEVALLQQVANQLAIAIQQSALHQQIQTELTERRQIETQLRASLQEKEILLKEVHHRVKNNLQVISSVLWLQAKATQHPAVFNALVDTRTRLQAMALIHETLYESTNLEQLNFHDYIQRLSTTILAANNTHSNSIRLVYQLQPIVLNLETAIPCGLLLNELVNNAVKHAFPDDRVGEICITLKEQVALQAGLTLSDSPDLAASQSAQPTRYILIVQDNGVGIPADVDLKALNSLGLKITYDLTLQLRGSLELDSTNGTRFQLTFSALDYRKRL